MPMNLGQEPPISPPLPPPGDPAVFLADLAWTLARSLITFVICFVLGLIGIRLLDKITPRIKEIEMIRGKPVPTALYSSGFFIFLGLIFYASVVSPLPIGLVTGVGYTVTPVQLVAYKLITMLAGLGFSLLFAVIFYRVMAIIEPFGIDLDDVQKEPIAVGVYVMGYLIFLGLIFLTVLTLPV